MVVERKRDIERKREREREREGDRTRERERERGREVSIFPTLAPQTKKAEKKIFSIRVLPTFGP